MTNNSVPYPANPTNVPPDLTTPSTSYRLRVIIVLSSLLAFVLIYVGLLVGSAYLCYWCWASLVGPPSENAAGLQVLRDAERTMNRIIPTYNYTWQRAAQHQINDADVLLLLDHDVLTPWRAMRQRLDQVHDLPRDQQQLIDTCREAFQRQEESFKLIAKAVRNQDAHAVEQATEKKQEAERLFNQLAHNANRYYSSRATAGERSASGFWLVVGGILSGLLCLFLIKGFFKWRRANQAQRVEITEQEQPAVFGFIHRVCQDTRAPRPHRVYLSPDVNASVFYNQSILSLFLPTPKNLLIGLGLVNQLNLSEFKAVLAHEFGHFSQNSMKLGSYVYTANRVIGDLVFGRDWLDDLVAGICRLDIRIAVFGWAFRGIVWMLRKTLQGLFRVINFAHSSLSRQMEFNADLVAVSVTGSDALVHGLARLDFATESLAQAWNDLSAAADQHLYSRDLFYHQTRAAAYLRALRNNPRLGEPPDLPADPQTLTEVFPPEDTSTPRMWATHPSNHDREVNAKRHYIRSPIDERSPWILFQDAPAVRQLVTYRVYKQNRDVPEDQLQAPEVVQAFIDEEHAATTYHPRYQGLYEDRYLRPGDLDELLRSMPAEPATVDQLTSASAQLYGDELSQRMTAHKARQEEFSRLAPIVHGAAELKRKDFQFRGSRYRAAEAGKLLDEVRAELEEDLKWMADLDRQAFVIHYDMARHVGEDAVRELVERYRFHLAVQEMHQLLSAHRQQIHQTLNALAGRRELPQEEYQGVRALLRSAHSTLGQQLEVAKQLRVPPLKNLKAGEPLGPILLTTPLVERPKAIDGAWIGPFMEQAGEVIERLQRIHFKSLGGILSLQEQLAQQCGAISDVTAATTE